METACVRPHKHETPASLARHLNSTAPRKQCRGAIKVSHRANKLSRCAIKPSLVLVNFPILGDGAMGLPWNGTFERSEKVEWNGRPMARAPHLCGWRPRLTFSGNEKYSQLLTRLCAPFIREVCKQFRTRTLSASEAADQLGIGKRRFYQLFTDYLTAVGRRKAHLWSPKVSGGNHRQRWPEAVRLLISKLLKTGCSFSMIASEALRRFHFKVDRASIRRYALREGLVPAPRPAKAKPVRRWQTQQIGQLWQYDASPHHWFCGQNWQPTLLHILDDHSRVITGARLYARETLLAHLEFLSHVFQVYGLPLCLLWITTAFSLRTSLRRKPTWERLCAFTEFPFATPRPRKPKAKSNEATSFGRNAYRHCLWPSTSPNWDPPMSC